MTKELPSRAIHLARSVLSGLLGSRPAGRYLTVFPDDIFIVSYPRSGNTWLRFLIGNLVFYNNESMSFSNIERWIPDIYANSDRILHHIRRPRILKSHESYDPRYRNIIYVVRDPRDVVVSYYYYQLKMKKFVDSYTLNRFVHKFCAGTLDHYGAWGDHVQNWLDSADNFESFSLLRYEDLKVDLLNQLKKLEKVLGFDEAVIPKAIELSSANKMRKLERDQFDTWKPLKGSRRDIPFVREANVGGWRSHLSQDSIQLIEDHFGKHMHKLGYD